MTTPLTDAETVLAIDIGSVTTRALLFDVVDGIYTFISAGSAPTTAAQPFGDLRAGVRSALQDLQQMVGRNLITPEEQIIIPSKSTIEGVDRLVVTYSAGEAVSVVVIGLLESASLESARRLAGSTYARVTEIIGLNDRRRMDAQLDAVLRAAPDIILAAGGTEGGASRSVGRLLDLVAMSLRVTPPEKRPTLIYAGNQALAKRVSEVFERITDLRLAPNLRPEIDNEDLSAAQLTLQNAVMDIQRRRVNGLEPLAAQCAAPPVTTAHAFGRMVRFLSKVYDPIKGVLGVDLGGSTTLFAAAAAGELNTGVYPVGMGAGLNQALSSIRLEDITRWLPLHLPDAEVRDYLWNKSLHPNSVPLTPEALAIEQAAARQVLRWVTAQFTPQLPQQHMFYEPILASGAPFSHAPQPGQSLMMLLDGLQPVGITILMLDQNRLTASLGAISGIHSLLPVQVLESGAYLNLGTVICPLSEARIGTPILDVHLIYDKGSESRLTVRQGSLVQLPLQIGQVARVHLTARHGTVIDPRSKHEKVTFKIVGGACGAVIDARGRPLNLPPDASRRRDLLRKWANAVGG